MKKWENKIIEWVENNVSTIFLIACILLGIIIRTPLRNFASRDFDTYLKGWYVEIAKNGLYKQVGNYNFLYQFAIWILTKFPFIPSLFSYKILSILFDLVLAIVAYFIMKKENGGGKPIIAFCLIWLSPIVFLNSAAWAQCDSIYSTFVILALYMLSNKKYSASMCILGIAFAFKLQAVFVLPLFLFVYFVRKEFSITKFLLVPISMIGVSLPLLFWGRNILDIFSIYFDQTNSYPAISMNYPSFWMLMCKGYDKVANEFMKIACICFAIFALALLMYRWLKKGYSTNGKNLYMMAYLIVYTCVLFLPGMHERYGYVYEILAIILALLVPKMIPICIGLVCISLNTYGCFLFSIDINLMLLATINTLIYVVSIYLLEKEMNKTIK